MAVLEFAIQGKLMELKLMFAIMLQISALYLHMILDIKLVNLQQVEVLANVVYLQGSMLPEMIGKQDFAQAHLIGIMTN